MWTPTFRSVWKKKGRALVTTACLAVSAVAVVATAGLDSPPARAEAREEAKEAKPAPAPSPALTKEPVALASTSGARPATAAALVVPDWKGKRLSVARREGRKLGLLVTARDDAGEPVPPDQASGYRVRRQLTSAGTPVEPGAAVELRVREIVDTVSGY
jgi:hypothetical protein